MQDPSSKDHSINSAAVSSCRFQIEQQTISLAQCCPGVGCCPRGIYISVPILAILGVMAFMIQQGFDCNTTITHVNITIKELPMLEYDSAIIDTPLLPYSSITDSLLPYTYPKIVNGASVPESVKWFWQSGAKYNAVINGFCSLVWPFLSGVILIHLFLVRFRIRNQKYRTIALCVLMQTGKFGLTQPFCNTFQGIVEFVNKDSDLFQFEIISAPANEYANYCFSCSMFGIFAFGFLFIDQTWMYDNEILSKPSNKKDKDIRNVNEDVAGHGSHGSISVKYSFYQPVRCKYPKNEFFSLLFVNKRESVYGVIFDALFYTILSVSIFIILEALYTAQVGFTVGGLFGGGAVVIKSAQNIGATAADYLILSNALQKIFVEQFMVIGVIMPMIVQSLIVFVWIVPLKLWFFRWMIRGIFILQSVNALEVYLIAVLLCFEYDSYTKWFSANEGGSPQLCGVGSPVYDKLGGCIYADPFFNAWGVVLLVIAVCVQWFTFIYTLKTASKLGIDVLRFR